MTIRIEEFVAHLGWEVDSGDLKEFDDQVQDITDTFKTVAVAIGAAAVAVTALITHTNKETAEMANLAKSVGLTTDNLLALSGVVSELGLNTDNVIDLVEEMNNKIGEKKGLGNFTAVEESMQLLNLSFKELENLEPDQQFIKILDAAAKLEDQQRAVSAVDMLFGGEANKIVGFIREAGISLEDLIERRKQLNFLSDDGIEGAVAFNRALTETQTIIGSVWAQFSGLVGEAIRPLLEEFNDFVIANKELIKIKVAEWAEKVAAFLEEVWKFLKLLLGTIKKVTDLFGGLENVLAIIVGIVGGLTFVKLITAFKLLIALIPVATGHLTLFKAALSFGKMAGAIGLLVLAGLAVNSLVRFLQGKDSLVGDIGESIADSMIVGTEAIAGLFNMTGEELQYFLVQTVDDIGQFFINIWETLVKFREEVTNLGWAGVWEFWKEIFSEGAEAIKNFFIGVLDFILSIPGRVVNAFKGLPGTIAGFLKQIPGIGTIVKGIGSLVGGEPASQQSGSPGLASQIQQNRTINNIANRPNTESTTNVHARMEITQLPGEDSTEFANKVVGILEENAATAVRNNRSGIKV